MLVEMLRENLQSFWTDAPPEVPEAGRGLKRTAQEPAEVMACGSSLAFNRA